MNEESMNLKLINAIKKTFQIYKKIYIYKYDEVINRFRLINDDFCSAQKSFCRSFFILNI